MYLSKIRMDRLERTLKERILVLDGALGTMIQKYDFNDKDFRAREFIKHSCPLVGFNDILNITKPSSIKEIHKKYLEAGANIITTNTFNSNPVSMKDYGLENYPGLVKRLNREGAKLAKEALKEFETADKEELYFIGGSIGPTNRSTSMSPDISNPLKRNITYDELKKGYKEQIEGLIEGEVDLLIFETFFDTLNLKVALDAANSIMREKGIKLPIMVSATVSDNAGRILSGQTLEAFVTSISHYDNIKVIGINCGFGPERMKDYIKAINKVNPFFTSCHPNAGLPDEWGCYDVGTEEFKESVRSILKEREINIIGGCCGTTPDYIRELAKLVKEYSPKKNNIKENVLELSGLDRLEATDKFLTIGERCNVAGSSKFLRLIKEESLEAAAEIAKDQIAKGAEIIDINLDDPLLDVEKVMVKFLRYILAEPEIAKVPFMIDSSNWDVIESALKNIQGKGIVNSLSLKEGEESFIAKARKTKELGFALVVMAFDEKGQADTFERKVEICERSYKLLTEKCGFNPEDIVFDVNVMTIGTGMKEHSRYAIDFIKTVEWIKKNLPGTRTSGGISNLSFAFRGKNKIREFMHVIFLYHAKKAGLDMAIINPAQKTKYEDIPLNVRNTIEDLIFDRDDEAVEKLIKLTEEDHSIKVFENKKYIIDKDLSIEEILKNHLIKGELKDLEEDLSTALEFFKDPVTIIEGPLLNGMKHVGDLFGEGKMFLPQVIKTARTMKRAVDILTPHIEKANKNKFGKKSGKILIATVKGDVHDIGKNIVSTVLACNNYEIIDLGIMVSAEKIVETALEEKPDIICLSGLITPSLGEMTNTVRMLDKAGITTPVMVGGAATSFIHTALKIDPEYSGLVLHMSDASQNPIASNLLLNSQKREGYIQEINDKYEALRKNKFETSKILPFKDVLKLISKEKRNQFIGTTPKVELGHPIQIDIPFEEMVSKINWKMYFLAWRLQGKYIDSFPFSSEERVIERWLNNLNEEEKDKAKEALQLYEVTSEILKVIKQNFDGKGLIRFEKAKGDERNIYISGKEFPMLRQQREGTDFLSCSDFIGDNNENYIGLFTVTAGLQPLELLKNFEARGELYKALIVQTISDRIAEASAEWLQEYVSNNYWPVSIRPAWGYPMIPDQMQILNTKEFLPYEKIGISLTENGAMFPPASISGLYLSHPKAKYFIVGKIGEDQLEDYALRRGIAIEKLKELLRYI